MVHNILCRLWYEFVGKVILSISGKGCLAEKDLARGPVKESSETAQEATERAERLEEQGTARRGRRPRGGRRGRSEEVTLARGRS